MSEHLVTPSRHGDPAEVSEVSLVRSTGKVAVRQAIAEGNVVELRDVLHLPFQPELHRDGTWAARRSLASVVPALMAGDLAASFTAWCMLLPFGAAEGVLPHTMALSSAVAVVLFLTASLYPGYRVHAHELLRRRTTAMLRTAAIACPGAGLLTGSWQPPVLVGAFLALAWALQLPIRYLVLRLLRRLGSWGEFAEILGPAASAEEVRSYFLQNWQCGVSPCDPAAPRTVGPGLALLLQIPSSEELARLRREHTEVILLADLPGIRTSGLRATKSHGEIGLRLSSTERRINVEFVDRALDVVVSLCAIAAFAPLMCAAALMIYASDPGPVLYRQKREGFRGRPFQIFKLRTMYCDAEYRLDALLERDPAARSEWVTHFKLRRDPRILPIVGEFLRATSVDELPQLYNVLTGDMRIVGPRPFPDYHLAAMDPGFRAKRGSVTPGLTGLWQISDRSTADLERQQRLDEFYIDNRSLWLDLQVMLQTASAVIRGNGAY